MMRRGFLTFVRNDKECCHFDQREKSQGVETSSCLVMFGNHALGIVLKKVVWSFGNEFRKSTGFVKHSAIFGNLTMSFLKITLLQEKMREKPAMSKDGTIPFDKDLVGLFENLFLFPNRIFFSQ